MITYDNELYKKYKYYNATEKSNSVQLIRTSFDKENFSIKQSIQYYNYIKFKGFYIIRVHSNFLYELVKIMIYHGKDYTWLQENLFILRRHLNFGYPKYNNKEIIDEYCFVYNSFQKINFIQRIQELTMIYQDVFCKNLIIDIKLSKSEYKLLEKFLLKQLKCENIIKIEHYPERGFIIKE